MDEDTDKMAHYNYGYGRWDAPYWFIGPEPGMDPKKDDLRRRVKAWVELGRRKLNDCREFHCLIGEKSWHFKKPVKLQPTWRPLMLMLMTFRGKEPELPVGKNTMQNLRNYQRDKWGTLYGESGETCVIELSGLAAPALAAPGDHGRYRQERIEVIRRKIHHHRPKLVVMYGLMQRDSWEKIAKTGFPPEPASFIRCGPTVLALARHPVAPNPEGNEYWVKFGRNLREFVHGPADTL